MRSDLVGIVTNTIHYIPTLELGPFGLELTFARPVQWRKAPDLEVFAETLESVSEQNVDLRPRSRERTKASASRLEASRLDLAFPAHIGHRMTDTSGRNFDRPNPGSRRFLLLSAACNWRIHRWTTINMGLRKDQCHSAREGACCSPASGRDPTLLICQTVSHRGHP